MKSFYEMYDNTKTYFYPNMALASPEDVAQSYPLTTVAPCVIETNSNGTLFAGIYEYNAFVDKHDELIDFTGMLPTQVLAAVMAYVPVIPETPEVEHEPTAEERIAAALEFQILMGM